MSDVPNLSVVLPAFNEEISIETTLRSIHNWFAAGYEPAKLCEVIVVDDGSSDRTAEIVKALVETELGRHINLKLKRHLENQGKGFAVRTGMKFASGDFVLFMDADGEIPINNLVYFSRMLETNPAQHRVAIGIGGVADARPLYRRVLSVCARTAIALGCQTGSRDTQRGFKMFTQPSAHVLFGELRSTGWLFDVEVLRRAYVKGIKLEEVPVVWARTALERPSSLSLKAIPDGLRELAQIRKFEVPSLTSRVQQEPDQKASGDHEQDVQAPNHA